ncbi:motility associated factor glycosyltransferase family protein [Caldicellulosiruptor acetigenus]|uniref:motility associated factor glycosyltransferase family protein n=1 Tax=Caldicellulosiruptor acetigenus TaxID=301953 RepID=UPI00041AA565|nr:6-hydroxymethylpterin diphosphokinase MptE-like protein [Caldicellulosiruptor acetigenus]WAM37250.1 DUF115 domain-containing protein [Caldicellulosiruptor acetigenus]
MKRNIFARNLEVIKRRFKYIYEKLDKLNTANRIKENIEVRSEVAKDSNIILKVNMGSKEYYLSSKYKPVEEAKKLVNAQDLRREGINILFGIGNIYLVRELLNYIYEDGRLIIIEPYLDIFIKIIELIDITDILEDERVIIWIFDEDAETLENMLDIYLDWTKTEKTKFILSPNYDKFSKEESTIVLKIIRDLLVDNKLTVNTILYFDKMWQENILKNLRYLLESSWINNFKDSFISLPAVIVSAGPSLNKNIHLLKQINDKAIILTGGRTLKILIEHGVKPDFVVTIDGSEKNYKLFENVDYSDIPLLYSPRTHYRILEQHKGKFKIMINSDHFTYNLFMKYGIDTGFVGGGGSVSCFAFDIATRIFNCSPIIFVGQDLAYTNGLIHAIGAHDRLNEIRIEGNPNLLYVDGIMGDKVVTDYSLYNFLRWFERRIIYDNSGRLYINATEGGANIKGTIPMKLSEVIDSYFAQATSIEGKKKEELEKRFKVVDNHTRIGIIKELENISKDLSEILEKVNEALELNKRLLMGYDKSILEKLESIDNFLNDKFKAGSLVDDLLLTISYEVLNHEINYEIPEKANVDVVEKGEKLYKGIKKAIEYSLPILQESLKEIKNKPCY